jgi:anti-sigma regulatory factor (Ser/Thr protein kinase)
MSDESVIYEESFPVVCETFENAGRVSTQVKALLKGMKLAAEVVRRAAIVTYEAEMNIFAYAEHGEIILRVTPEQVAIEVIDEGQGIADIQLAMQEGFSTATEEIWRMGFGAGMGLSNIKNFSDYFCITSEVGKGTHLKMVIRIDDERDGM